MLVLVPGAGAVSWRCWCRVPVLVLGAGRRCCELAVHVVETDCWCSPAIVPQCSTIRRKERNKDALLASCY